MKLPNSYGSVYKLSGKRRKPFVARKTIGWKDNGQPIYQYIGYYEKRADALEALANYNKDPYDIVNGKMTFAELYEKWSAVHFENISKSNINGTKAAYKLCATIQKMNIHEIKLSHLQYVVDNSGKNYPTLRKVKVMLGLMYDFAVKNEILKKDKRDMISYIDISKAGNPNALDRKPFTKPEIKKLWDAVNENEIFQIPLILIYTGLRIGEFFNIKKEDVHLNERYFVVTASKTDAGLREVPIAEKIVPFFENWLSKEGKYAFPNSKGNKHTDRAFRDGWWMPMMKELEMENHRPHDARHTCVSLLTEAGVDERIIKKIVGHKGEGVTQQVYTHIDMPYKLEAINMI
jgi:integrase